MARPDVDGYFTDTFCIRSRFVQPHNGRRIDAMRDAIERDYRDSWMYPVLLTSLIEAADRVDSTTGVQMAYVKQWADRSFRPIELRVPELVAGPGAAVRADALDVVKTLGPFDLAYLDPPYNQHRYFTNYHVWETLVAWDAPEHYGIACKRVDARDPSTKSVFNDRRAMPDALATRDPRRRRRARRRLVQQRVVGRDRRPRSGVPGARRRGRDARVRLASLRRRADRHPQPGRREGRAGVASAQCRIRGLCGRAVARRPHREQGRRAVEIAGNVALVTGAASGLGEATARRLHAAGAEVVLADIADERGRAIATELGGADHFVHCDVTSEVEVAGRGRDRRRLGPVRDAACTAVAAASRRARSRATERPTTSTPSAASSS